MFAGVAGIVIFITKKEVSSTEFKRLHKHLVLYCGKYMSRINSAKRMPLRHYQVLLYQVSPKGYVYGRLVWAFTHTCSATCQRFACRAHSQPHR